MIHKRILIASLILLALALIAFVVTEYSLRTPPEIYSLSKLQCLPGEKILIEGNGFGDQQGTSRLYFGQREIKVSHIDIWDNQTIRFRVPSFEYSAMIRIKTSAGESEGGLVYNRDQFPQLVSGSFLPGLPYIEYVDPSGGRVGNLVELKGYDFGDNRGQSRILVNRRPDNPLSYFEEPETEDFTTPVEEDYLLWENDRIRFYLPDQAESGFIYIHTAKGFSNPVYFEVEQSAGIWELLETAQILLYQQVLIDRIGSLSDNQLYLWLPKPDNRGNQSNITVMTSRYSSFLETEGVDLLRLQGINTGDTIKVDRNILLQISKRIARLEPDKIPSRYNGTRTIYTDNIQEEPSFPVSDRTIRSIAVSVCRGVSHPYYRSEKIFEYVQAKLTPEKEHQADVLTSLQQNRGDAENYADSMVTLCRIMGIPARKVAGIRLTPSGSQRHFWVEVYFEGFGWFSADPYRADSEESQDEKAFCWGGEPLDRVAFSRGNITLHSVDDSAVGSVPEGYYSLQNLYQQKSGNISSYRSRWILPEEIDRF